MELLPVVLPEPLLVPLGLHGPLAGDPDREDPVKSEGETLPPALDHQKVKR